MKKQKEIIGLTKKLIKISSVKDNPKELKKVADFCVSNFSTDKFDIKRFESNNKHSLVITFKKQKNPDFFLVGHLDVVEAEKKEFRPELKNNKLYGRGAKDNKGPSAAMITLMKDFASENKNLSVGLMLTTDEEVGGFNGINYLLNKKNYSCKLAFIPDGGNDFEIISSEKGLIHFKLTAKGIEAHGARPFEGENAIDKIMEVYKDIKKKFPNPKNMEDWKSSLNLGTIKGGRATNIVAGEAEIYLDIRFTEEKKKEDILKEIKEIIKERARMEVIISGNPFYTSPNNSYIIKYKKALKEVLKREPIFKKCPTGSDARFFSEKGIPAIITNCKGGGTHGKDEWVDIDSLGSLYEILKKFILNNF